jgi:predicted TIM-barrel fold metal-dependent hydrolase
MRLITLEEHFRAPMLKETAAAQAFAQAMGAPGSPMARRIEKLDEIGDQRLAEMDAGGIDMQVLSHNVPGAERFAPAEAIPLARAVNDYLAEAVARHPERFAAFAMLPMQAPLEAADELERAITELGFKGAMIHGHTEGRFLDDRSLWPILERAQGLGVPIYLHPSEPPAAVREAYYAGGLSPLVGHALATSGWGWHVETGMHVLRMVLAGVFDEYPALQLVVGHMGEALPFLLARSSRSLTRAAGLSRPLEEYVLEHLHFTTSGLFTFPPLLCLLMVVGADRVLFSVDYPFADNEQGRDFMLGAPISRDDKEKIAHANAERLLGLAPVAA